MSGLLHSDTVSLCRSAVRLDTWAASAVIDNLRSACFEATVQYDFAAAASGVADFLAPVGVVSARVAVCAFRVFCVPLLRGAFCG